MVTFGVLLHYLVPKIVLLIPMPKAIKIAIPVNASVTSFGAVRNSCVLEIVPIVKTHKEIKILAMLPNVNAILTIFGVLL
jgi:hypothetical protein